MNNIEKNVKSYSEYDLKTISMLPRISAINVDALFEISVNDSTNNKWNSKSVSFDILQNQINNNTEQFLSSQHGLTEDIKFDKLRDNINAYIYGSEGLSVAGPHIFVNPPKIINSISEFDGEDAVLNEKYVINLESLELYNKKNNSIFLNDNGGFITKYYSIEQQEYTTLSNISDAPSTELEKHNAYIFRIVGTESNEWECPKSGWFTCYGWIDEDGASGNQSYNRWITLEGYFGSGENMGWKVLQLQPTITAQFCTYVSFSIPVKEGLKLRLRSGFKVGTNSGQYWSQRNSMTNHIANAFVGGIYNGYTFE